MGDHIRWASLSKVMETVGGTDPDTLLQAKIITPQSKKLTVDDFAEPEHKLYPVLVSNPFSISARCR